jgi:hypothetical protein
MTHTRSQAGFRVGQVVTYRDERVVIKAFPNRFTAMISPEKMIRARWITKTVAMSDLAR